MAVNLPLELQQHIFQYLDPRSFHASRNVCRWWRHASMDSVTLASQLRQMPIEPSVSPRKMSVSGLRSLYSDAARTLMLGMRTTEEEVAEQHLAMANIFKEKMAISRDGRRAVTLDNRQITLYDLESPQCPIISQRPLNDLRAAVGGGPWFKCAPTSVHELALSSDGSILAIGLDRTIQIYDLAAGEDSWPVSSYISSAAGHYIASLHFQHNDSLLRVQLSNKGTVLYLGTPQETPAGLKHWQQTGGLRHAFLDSSKAVLSPVSSEGAPETLTGLQLLRPFASGWLFAAQKRCVTAQSACYGIGHVAASEIDGHTVTAEKPTVILACLPDSVDPTSTLEPAQDSAHHVWHSLPSAFAQYPHFSLSADNSLLAISDTLGTAEKAASINRTFVFRLPSLRRLSLDLDTIRAEKQSSNIEINAPRIQRLPLNIACFSGKILDFFFDSAATVDAHGDYQISVVTNDGTKSWSLLDS